MIRFLPIAVIVVLILAGLGYWRFVASKSTLTSPAITQISDTPIEVPKTLPQSSLEDRVKELEDVVTKLVTQVNNLKSSLPQTQSSNSSDPNLSNIQSSVTELKARVSALEKATPAPVSSSQSVVYIPLGSGGGPWNNQEWYSTDYLVSLDPGNYPGYTGMYLEGVFRLTSDVGTAYLRLYNLSDGSAVSPEISTTSTTFTLKTSASFKLPTGSKNYVLQVKSSQNQAVQIQSARIKVNF